MDKAISSTTRNGTEDLPGAWQAVYALIDLLVVDKERGLRAAESGVFDGLLDLSMHEDRVQKIIQTVKKHLGNTRTGNFIRPVDDWWARLKERQMDLQISSPCEGPERGKSRLRL